MNLKIERRPKIKQQKCYFMNYCGTENLQPTSQFKMADRLTELPLGVAQHCSVLVFPLQIFYAENFVILFYEIKLLLTYLLLYITEHSILLRFLVLR